MKYLCIYFFKLLRSSNKTYLRGVRYAAGQRGCANCQIIMSQFSCLCTTDLALVMIAL